MVLEFRWLLVFLWGSLRFRRRRWGLGGGEGGKLNGGWDKCHRFGRVFGLSYGVKGEVVALHQQLAWFFTGRDGRDVD